MRALGRGMSIAEEEWGGSGYTCVAAPTYDRITKPYLFEACLASFRID